MLILLHGPSVALRNTLTIHSSWKANFQLIVSHLPRFPLLLPKVYYQPTPTQTTRTLRHCPQILVSDSNIYTAEKIVRQRLYKGKPQFEVKWKGYRQPTWKPLEDILDPSLITKYYQDHPRAKNIVHTPVLPLNRLLLTYL